MDQRQKIYFDLAAEKGIAIVIRSVLMKGLLSNRGRDLHPALKDVENFIKNYHQLIGPEITDLTSLAIQFALSFGSVSSVLVGIDKFEYLSHSLEVAKSGPLNREIVKKGNQLAYPDPEFLNLSKWSKMKWLE
jgi:aryl-alcohol dehydrogenase-like predicted oxidoreductase